MKKKKHRRDNVCDVSRLPPKGYQYEMAVRASDKLIWPQFSLNNNTDMPCIGINTTRLNTDESMKAAVRAALNAGCRMFETSGLHGNDASLGKTLKRFLYLSVLTRDDVFIIRKLRILKVLHVARLTNDKNRTKRVELQQWGINCHEMYTKHVISRAFSNTLENLGTDYIDLLLITCPGSYETSLKTKHKMICNSAWDTITKLYDEGQVNSIGVADFSGIQLQELINENHNSVPCVNQIGEWLPNQCGQEISSSCHKNAVVMQSRYSIADVDDKYKAMGDKTLRDIALNLDVTPDQVLLAWNLQNDIPVVVDTTNPKQITRSFQLGFRLKSSQMSALNKLFAKK